MVVVSVPGSRPLFRACRDDRHSGVYRDGGPNGERALRNH